MLDHSKVCISTGIFKFPNEESTDIAIKAVRWWLEPYHFQMEQIVFFTYEDGDFGFYQRLLSEYFPTLDNRSVTTHSMKYKNDDPSIDSTTTNCHVLVSTGKSDETNHANLNETRVITMRIYHIYTINFYKYSDLDLSWTRKFCRRACRSPALQFSTTVEVRVLVFS